MTFHPCYQLYESKTNTPITAWSTKDTQSSSERVLFWINNAGVLVDSVRVEHEEGATPHFLVLRTPVEVEPGHGYYLYLDGGPWELVPYEPQEAAKEPREVSIAKEVLQGRDPDKSERLGSWWREVAENEIDQTVEKATEYGSTDLEDLGHSLARMMNRRISDTEAAELGIMFYLRGKMARWEAAVIDGRRVSDDTVKDIGIYARMVQRLRVSGAWPGV